MNDNEYKERVIASMGEDMFNKYEAFRTEIQEVICKYHLIMEDTKRTASCIMSSLILYLVNTEYDNLIEWSDIFVESLHKTSQMKG